MTSDPPSTTTAKDPPQAHTPHTPDESSMEDNPQPPKLRSQLSPLSFKPMLPLPFPSACTRASYTPLYLVVPQEFGALDLARGRAYAGACGGCYDKWRDRQMGLWMEYHQAEWYGGERLKGNGGMKEGVEASWD